MPGGGVAGDELEQAQIAIAEGIGLLVAVGQEQHAAWPFARSKWHDDAVPDPEPMGQLVALGDEPGVALAQSVPPGRLVRRWTRAQRRG